jgi:TolB protein
MVMSTVLVAVALSTIPSSGAGATFPGANGRIVFASGPFGEEDIYVMAADGTNQQRLTDAAGRDQYPVWSADGTRIVFSSGREGLQKIFTMNPDGTAQTRITDPPGPLGSGDEEPTWSRNGNKIVFRSDREGGSQIWAMNSDGSGIGRLTFDGLSLNPAWSPNVDRIAFASDRDGDFELYSMDAFGGNVVQYTTNDASDFDPSWSPDGTKIAFQSNVDGDFDIWMLSGTNTLTQLTNDPGLDSAPAWSPDGTQIAFQSNRDGDFEIFTMNADGSDVVQLTHNDVFDRVADWQPLTLGGDDTTPPTLSVPAPITVDATSRDGAIVTYTVSATDVVDPAPTVSCTPSSGSTFPIGTTTVSCTATDRAGNTSTGFIVVTVKGVGDQVESLFTKVVNASALPATQKTLLVNRLQTLLANFDPDNPAHRFTVCNTLGLFAILVSAWSGRGIPTATADEWLADVRRIRSILLC